MRKIFLDAGANNGCSVRKFKATCPDSEDYFIYSFEVEPKFFDNFDDIENHMLIKKAVWVGDETLEFFQSKAKYNDGGTLIKSKKTGNLDKKNPLLVEAIDFSTWIRDSFDRSDYIILKMDIEGAEYAVLSKMLEDNTMEYINELWIEWHPKKIGLPQEVHDSLISKIEIPIKTWDALKW